MMAPSYSPRRGIARHASADQEDCDQIRQHRCVQEQRWPCKRECITELRIGLAPALDLGPNTMQNAGGKKSDSDSETSRRHMEETPSAHYELPLTIRPQSLTLARGPHYRNVRAQSWDVART